MANFKEILDSIPEVKKEDLITNKLLLEDIQKMHHSLTLDNPLTYFIYLDREKDLTIEERNVIFRIISRLKKNNQILGEATIEKHKLESVTNDST